MVVSEGVEELGGLEEVPGTRCVLRVAGWMVVNEGVEELGGDETIKDAGCNKK